MMLFLLLSFIFKIGNASIACPPLPAASGAGRRAQLEQFMFFYTYVLKSIKDGKLYIGWTPNLKERLLKHNKGLVDSTRDRRPLELVYYESCIDEAKAVKREKYFKSGAGRNFLKNRI